MLADWASADNSSLGAAVRRKVLDPDSFEQTCSLKEPFHAIV